MTTILDRIVASKRREIEAAKARVPEKELLRRLSSAPPVRDFQAAIDVPGTIQFITEVKRASPSAGVIRPDFDPVAIARTYADHGAACISVLTDEPFFQGHLSHLEQVRAAVSLPVLRKDFILDSYQLVEARAAGADAVLLIAELLENEAIVRHNNEAWSLGGMQCLVEVHDANNLQRVLNAGVRLIGVNNRDLRTFETRLEHTLDLMGSVPAKCCLVSESGIRSRADVLRLQESGVRAVLVGETLMRAADIGAKLDELRGVGG